MDNQEKHRVHKTENRVNKDNAMCVGHQNTQNTIRKRIGISIYRIQENLQEIHIIFRN